MKSGMAYRQIDVWVRERLASYLILTYRTTQFQNRRSRAKRDGKILKKLSTHEEPKILHLLEGMVHHKPVPESEHDDPVGSDVSEYEWQHDSDEDPVSKTRLVST